MVSPLDKFSNDAETIQGRKLFAMYDVFKYPLISTYLFIIDLFLVLTNLAFKISFVSNNTSRSLELSLEPSLNNTTHPDYRLNSTKFEFKADSSQINDTLGYRVFKLTLNYFQPTFILG